MVGAWRKRMGCLLISLLAGLRREEGGVGSLRALAVDGGIRIERLGSVDHSESCKVRFPLRLLVEAIVGFNEGLQPPHLGFYLCKMAFTLVCYMLLQQAHLVRQGLVQVLQHLKLLADILDVAFDHHVLQVVVDVPAAEVDGYELLYEFKDLVLVLACGLGCQAA